MVLTAQVMFWGICLRVSGGSTWEWVHPLGAQSPLACQTRPPLGAQVSLCDQSLKHFVRWESPISQSVSHSVGWGLRWWVIAQEAVGSGRASTCASTLIPHAGGDLSWAGRSSAVAKNVFFFYYCTCICAHLHTCLCLFTTHVNAQMGGKKSSMSIYIFSIYLRTKLSFFRTLQSNTKLCSPGGTLNMCR